MNTVYLMQYVSRHLHTILRRYDSGGSLLDRVCMQKDFSDDEIFSEDFSAILLASASEDCPVIFTGASSVTYAVVSALHEMFVVGPVILETDSKSNFPLPEQTYTAGFLRVLYRCEVRDFIDKLMLIHNLCHESVKTFEEMIHFNWLHPSDLNQIHQKTSRILFENMENTSLHNPHDQELRELHSIRTGDLEQLQKSWEEDYTGQVGTLAKTKLRSSKNLAIVLVTLASRAAMEGGVHPEIAHSLSDSYIQKIDEISNAEAAVQLGREAEYHYASLVHQLQTDGSPAPLSGNLHVERAKAYIFAHLHEKIRIPEISESLYLNANYLSNLFRKEEGISIEEYILMAGHLHAGPVRPMILERPCHFRSAKPSGILLIAVRRRKFYPLGQLFLQIHRASEFIWISHDQNSFGSKYFQMGLFIHDRLRIKMDCSKYAVSILHRSRQDIIGFHLHRFHQPGPVHPFPHSGRTVFPAEAGDLFRRAKDARQRRQIITAHIKRKASAFLVHMRKNVGKYVKIPV